MCRNIKTLYNFDPPVAPDEVRAASLQFVRKISGFHKPSKANEESCQAAIDEIFGGGRQSRVTKQIPESQAFRSLQGVEVLELFFPCTDAGVLE